jgi:serine/threonine-protein kinase
MMADTTTDAHIGRVVAGYRIEEKIGRGGMGVVYRAEHLNLRRRAAIKIIAARTSPPSCAPRAACARTARSTSAARSPPPSTPPTARA